VSDIAVRNLAKSFGKTVVLDDLSFDVRDGEFFTLLGPSGCGKTTMLLSIAGFVRPERGQITCGGRQLLDAGRKVDVPAEQRELGMVFQSYALWPHMTAGENVAFPLRIRKVKRRARAGKVREALELVELADLAGRYPHQLSGGQRQRVALARALVYDPTVLLLDEPFSNLDAKLRERTRAWLKRIQREVGLTTVFVTHDQDEAMELSDRILVLDDGRIQQLDKPEAIYRRPANQFVADFLGSCNILDATTRADLSGGRYEVALDPDGLPLQVTSRRALSIGEQIRLAIRPHAIRLVSPGNGAAPNVFDARIEDKVFLGDHHEYRARLGGLDLLVSSTDDQDVGAARLAIDPDACIAVEKGPEEPGSAT
jgi:iron(III) transport system ATP-binding protein